MKMDITKVGVHHVPHHTAFFKCENGKFYINEEGLVWFTTFRDIDQINLNSLYNQQSSIESELDHCKDIFQREELLIKLQQINDNINKELKDEIDQPYQVKITDKQLNSFIAKMKEARKDSVRSVAWKVGCPIEFEGRPSIPNREKFSWEWHRIKKEA